MNCAYHADQSAVAYCRTCGKALCANCTRPVQGVIYCENCLAARMGVGAPASSFAPGAAVPPPGVVPPPPPGAPAPGGSGPNPTVAGILGAIPFGVGAVYNGQYAKGLAHLVIFALLIAGVNVGGSEMLQVVCGLGIAFFWLYQIMDAVRSAKAIQAGLPAPDPYGLAASFGAGSGVKTDTSKIPTGAIVLILLGILFLLHTAGLFEYGFERIWPVFLIALGGWLLARNYGVMGERGDSTYARRQLTGPIMLITIGGLWLLATMDRPNLGFGHTWPVILLVLGILKLVQRSGPNSGTPACGGVLPPPGPPAPPASPAAPTTSSEVGHSEVNHG